MASNLLYYRRIKKLYYSEGQKMLTIMFGPGDTKEYCNVPNRIYRKLEAAPDQNEYFNKNIYGNYPVL